MIATRSTASITVAVLGIALAMPRTAWAQEPARDPIAAEALFERGKQLVEQGHTAEACAAFDESQRLDPAGGTLLRLALCHEAEGKLATSWLEFLEVLRMSKEGAGEPAKLQERVRLAREHLASLEPRVPRVVVSVPPAARVDGLHVTANGLPRNAGTWGVALPVDPGDVEIAASAPGRRPFRAVIHVGEGQHPTVEVPPLELETPAVRPLPPPPPPATHGSSLRPVGLAVGVVGLVAVGVGSYFGVHAIARWNDANHVCPGKSCDDPAGVSAASDALQSAHVADATIAAGAAVVVAGVVLYLLGAPVAPASDRPGETALLLRF
jgi:hypothetical protein